MPMDQAIAEKMLWIDQQANTSSREKLAILCASFSDDERQHPLGQWIIAQQDRLDWEDNIGQFLTAFWGLPRRPWVPGEQTEEAVIYQAALEKVLARLDRSEATHGV